MPPPSLASFFPDAHHFGVCLYLHIAASANTRASPRVNASLRRFQLIQPPAPAERANGKLGVLRDAIRIETVCGS